MSRSDAFSTSVSSIARARNTVPARRLRARAKATPRPQKRWSGDGLVRETYRMTHADARVKARDYFDRYPRQAYMTRVEHWQRMPDGAIEFTMVRLPTAD